jgi:hypothetical protein
MKLKCIGKEPSIATVIAGFKAEKKMNGTRIASPPSSLMKMAKIKTLPLPFFS